MFFDLHLLPQIGKPKPPIRWEDYKEEICITFNNKTTKRRVLDAHRKEVKDKILSCREPPPPPKQRFSWLTDLRKKAKSSTKKTKLSEPSKETKPQTPKKTRFPQLEPQLQTQTYPTLRELRREWIVDDGLHSAARQRTGTLVLHQPTKKTYSTTGSPKRDDRGWIGEYGLHGAARLRG